jgi:hypothetical protein
MDDDITRRVDGWLDRAKTHYEGHGKVFRVLWVLTGVIVVLAGIAMIVVPGPVTVVVPAGLVMLAVVFGWARKLLLLSVEKGVDAKHRVDEISTKAKVLGGAALACLAAAVVVAVVAWQMG